MNKSDVRRIIKEEIQLVKEVKDIDDLIRKAISAYGLDDDEMVREFFYKLNNKTLGKGLLALIKFDLRKLK